MKKIDSVCVLTLATSAQTVRVSGLACMVQNNSESASRYARAACQNVFPARIRMSFVFSFMLFSFLFSQWAEQSPAPTKAPLCKGSCQPTG